jgi:dTMP kinase
LRRWIIVEGLDGSGKSTIAKWIRETYEERGDRVLVQIHPSDRWTGRIARRCLQSKGMHMYVLSTMFFIIDVLASLILLRRWADKYDDVVFVRYAMAAAYLPKRYVKTGYDVIVKVLPLPNMLLLVDIAPTTAMKRMSARDDTEEMFENIEDLTKVREKVMMLSDGWNVLDNNQDEVTSRKQLERIVANWDHVQLKI